MRNLRRIGIAAALALATAGARADEDEGSMGGGAGGPAPAKAQDPAPATTGEDVLVLADGREIRGRITAEDEHSYAVKVGGAVRLVPRDGVKEVRRGAPAPDAPPAAGDPAAPKPDGKTDPKRDRRARRRAAAGDAPADAGAMDVPAPPPLSETAAAWARICIDRFLGEDASVRRSAGDALRALGPDVAPLVREAAAKAGEAGKYALEELARSAEARSVKRPDGDPAAGPAPDAKASRARAVFDRVRTELGLDESQAATVGARLLEYGRDVRETTMDARDGLISYEDARAKAGELRSKLRESLAAELSAEQLAKLDGILDSLTPGGKGGKKAPPPKEKDPAPAGGQ